MNSLAINASTATSSTTGTNPQAQSINQLTGNDFLTLLTAQLKSQDPTAPQDPTQFVGQLVQFNSLQQLIDINQSIQQLTAGQGSSGSTSGTGASSSGSQTAAGVAQKMISILG